MISDQRPSERGVALIESLVSLAVVGFGLLALCGLQVHLTRHTDTARQRTDATHLAQEKLEQIRGFGQIESGSSALAWSDLTAGRDEASVLASQAFHRQWALSGTEADLHRIASVTVDWQDRSATGARSGVTLTTLISRTDPIDSGSLVLPPADGVVRRTRLRDGWIPFARQLGGANRGKSALAWPGEGHGHLVFDNVTGAVIARCSASPGDTTNLNAECNGLTATWLDGYIDSEGPLGAATIAFESGGESRESIADDCIIDRTAGRDGLRHYQCIVASSAPQGTLRFSNLPASATACRYEAERAATFPASYTRSPGSSHRQNFLLTSAAACPPGTVTLPSA